MNLHGIAAGVISAINPLITLSIQVSTGSTTLADGTRVPSYASPVSAQGQVQPLSTGDIRHLDALNIQSVMRRIYINGQVSGLIRPDHKGGDLITTPDGRIWLTTEVVEAWPDWCSFYATLQDGA